MPNRQYLPDSALPPSFLSAPRLQWPSERCQPSNDETDDESGLASPRRAAFGATGGEGTARFQRVRRRLCQALND